MPHHFATRAHATCLQAGAAGQDNHAVFAKARGPPGLSYAQPLTCADHQNDRDDAPSDTEHRQESSKLVAPERLQRVTKQVFEAHCKTTWSPSLRPSISSVLTPFEIPSFTATRVLPFSAFAFGISRKVLRSLSYATAASGTIKTFFFSSRMISALAVMLSFNSPSGLWIEARTSNVVTLSFSTPNGEIFVTLPSYFLSLK